VTAAVALRILLRRWYVAGAVMLLAAAFLAVSLRSAGVYATDARLEFLPPGGLQVTAQQDGDLSPVTSFAASIVTQFDDGRVLEPFATTSAPLYGVGVRQGVQVALENSGNQWVDSFSTPLVEIQVVGPTAQWVGATTQQIVAQLTAMSDEAQAADGVPADARITAELQPLTGTVEQIMPGTRDKLTAAAAILAAGFIVGTALAVWTDALFRKGS